MIEILLTLYSLILVYLLELTKISFSSLTCLSNSGKYVAYHEESVWQPRADSATQLCCSGSSVHLSCSDLLWYRCICTCCGSYEHSSLFDRFAFYLCFCAVILLVWSEITSSLNGKLVEAWRFCKNLLKGCLCKYSWNQHLCFWKGNNWWHISAEIVCFLDNVVFAVRVWLFFIIMLWIILFYDWSSSIMSNFVL